MAAPPGNPADTQVHGRRAGRRDRAGSAGASTRASTRAALPVPLDRLLLASLVVLVVASTWRFLTRHTMADGGLLVLALAAALLLTQAAALRVPAGSGRRTALVLVSALACVVLVLLAPSFAWCAVPVAFAVLGTLPAWPATGITIGLGVLVSVAWARVTGALDLTLVAGPTVMALVTVAAARALQAQAEQQRRLVTELVDAQAELAEEQRRSGALDERNRLARDLHDSVGQTLTSVGLVLSAAERDLDRDPTRARARITTAAEATRTALAEVRTVVADLSQGAGTSGERLVVALRGLVDELPPGTVGSLAVHGDAGDLPAPVADALLLSARGALANVREHSGASRVAVTLTALDDEVRLDVRDDGRGFAAASGRMQGHRGRADRRGHGIAGIRSRTEALGGTTAVESAPGEGTSLSIALPTQRGDRS